MSRPVPEYTIADLEEHAAIELPSLTNDEAVDLGLVGVEVIRERDLQLAVDVVVRGDLVFRAKLKETGPSNDQWLAGKAAVANHFGEPSLLVKARLVAEGKDLASLGLDDPTLRLAGGCVPLRVAGEIVGTITMSGEPEAIDHETVVETLTRYLNDRQIR